MSDRSFWAGKSVLVTGHTGFKGSWLSQILLDAGARVTGFALTPDTSPSLFELTDLDQRMDSVIGDVRDAAAVRETVARVQPEIVFHLAAQPLVRYSYHHPVETFETNVMGSVHLLEALRSVPRLRAVVNITTDKCYDNRNQTQGYVETDPLGGFDPYSSSKAASELVTAAYRQSFFSEAEIGIATARAGNVIGGGDWSADRLIPDAIDAFAQHRQVVLRFPSATRPWQHVLEPLHGYLLLAQRLAERPSHFSGSWNFGPDEEGCWEVRHVVEHIGKALGMAQPWRTDGNQHPHEASLLALDSSKAKTELGWVPTWTLGKALDETIEWYASYRSLDASALCLRQVRAYQSESGKKSHA